MLVRVEVRELYPGPLNAVDLRGRLSLDLVGIQLVTEAGDHEAVKAFAKVSRAISRFEQRGNANGRQHRLPIQQDNVTPNAETGIHRAARNLYRAVEGL